MGFCRANGSLLTLTGSQGTRAIYCISGDTQEPTERTTALT